MGRWLSCGKVALLKVVAFCAFERALSQKTALGGSVGKEGAGVGKSGQVRLEETMPCQKSVSRVTWRPC